MKVSVIIPTINEAEIIGQLITHLAQHGGNHLHEIIVADGGSKDGTIEIVEATAAQLIHVGKRSRAIQMNAGAKVATGDALYFLHADSVPPPSYARDIIEAIQNGHSVGSYRFKFDSNTGLKRINSWVTQFGLLVCRGGDQSMFVTRALFDEVNGFDEAYVIMEDFDFIKKARRKTNWYVIPKEIQVSSRKYDQNSYIRVQVANLIAFTMFNFGASVARIKSWYERILKISYE